MGGKAPQRAPGPLLSTAFARDSTRQGRTGTRHRPSGRVREPTLTGLFPPRHARPTMQAGRCRPDDAGRRMLASRCRGGIRRTACREDGARFHPRSGGTIRGHDPGRTKRGSRPGAHEPGARIRRRFTCRSSHLLQERAGHPALRSTAWPRPFPAFVVMASRGRQRRGPLPGPARSRARRRLSGRAPVTGPILPPTS